MELLTVKTENYIQAHAQKIKLLKEEVNDIKNSSFYASENEEKIYALEDEIEDRQEIIDTLYHYSEEKMQISLDKFQFMVKYANAS